MLAVDTLADSGCVADACTLAFEKIASGRVEGEIEGGGAVEGPAGDTVGSRGDGQPG